MKGGGGDGKSSPKESCIARKPYDRVAESGDPRFTNLGPDRLDSTAGCQSEVLLQLETAGGREERRPEIALRAHPLGDVADVEVLDRDPVVDLVPGDGGRDRGLRMR